MKCFKWFVLFMVFALVFPARFLAASGQTQTGTGEKKELPQWAKDLRRADIITFGAFPFTVFLGGIIVDTYRASQHDWDARYAPWPVNMGGSVSRTTEEHLATITVAAGGAVLIALADYIIQRTKRAGAEREASRLTPPGPAFIRQPWPSGEGSGGPPAETPLPGIEAPSGDETSGEAP
jgi:ABC-type Fe3+ transport system permease subunit